MDRLEALRQKFMNLDGVILSAIEETFADNDTVVEDLNISQLERGERSDGVILPDYSPRSVQVFGKPPGPIRLFDTGAFYRGITLVATREFATLEGRDSKTAELQADYGDRIIGLTEDNRREFQEEFIREGIREGLQKEFD